MLVDIPLGGYIPYFKIKYSLKLSGKIGSFFVLRTASTFISKSNADEPVTLYK
jgi:hypothetical protein